MSALHIMEKIKGKLFIAHNVQFDYGFVLREFSRLGISFKASRMCSVRLSRALYPDQQGHTALKQLFNGIKFRYVIVIAHLMMQKQLTNF